MTLVGGDLDESTVATALLPDVLAEHAGLIRERHTLRPFAVAMAGKGSSTPSRTDEQGQGNDTPPCRTKKQRPSVTRSVSSGESR